MSAIRTITIQGFRSLAELKDLELRPLNVLIGANGSGKSNFLGALDLLQTSLRNVNLLSEYVTRAGGAESLLHFRAKVTQTIRFTLSFEDQRDDFSLELRFGGADRFLPRIYVATTIPPTDTEPQQTMTLAKALDFELERWCLYHFHDTGFASPLKKTADVHDNRHLRLNGSNLAAFLYLLSKKYENSYRQIRRTVRLAAPFFDDFNLKPLALNEDKIRLEWRHVGSDAYLDASSLSDGTLRFIALATLLMQPASLRPNLILLDEPELGLHPYAITLLASLLKPASVDSRVIVATQSPILLDHFEPEDVLVAERVDGATELRRLDGEALKVWLEDYSLGQLWEKNELGGRLTSESKGRQFSP